MANYSQLSFNKKHEISDRICVRDRNSHNKMKLFPSSNFRISRESCVHAIDKHEFREKFVNYTKKC